MEDDLEKSNKMEIYGRRINLHLKKKQSASEALKEIRNNEPPEKHSKQ